MQLAREVKELQQELEHKSLEKKTQALRKVICAMNNGKNVGGLFFSVMKCLEIRDAEAKRLVYLYIAHYAQEYFEEAIMCVNSFARDARDKSSPVVRAIAIRTMSCLRVKDLNAYLLPALEEALGDADPHVKRTAVLAAAKVNAVDPELIAKSGVVEALCRLLQSEGNPAVLSSALLALEEIVRGRAEPLFVLDSELVERVLNCLPECSEWVQISLIDILGRTPIPSAAVREAVVERLLSRLSHINCGVVIASARTILMLGEALGAEVLAELLRKLSAPLASLANAPPDVAWTVLRNLQVLVDRHPALFPGPRAFFARATDASFVKLEKIKLVERLTGTESFREAVGELSQCAFDPVREVSAASLRAIGAVAVAVEESLETCLLAMHSLLSTGLENSFADNFLNECVVAIARLARRYPLQEELSSVIELVLRQYPRLTQSEAKRAFIDLFPRFPAPAEVCREVFQQLADDFLNLEEELQLAALRLFFSVYLRSPAQFQEEIAGLLTAAAQGVESHDVRDKLFFYWQLVDRAPEVMRRMLDEQRPPAQFPKAEGSLGQLVEVLGSLAATLHSPSIAKWPLSVLSAERAHTRLQKTDEEDFLGTYLSRPGEQFLASNAKMTEPPRDQTLLSSAQNGLGVELQHPKGLPSAAASDDPAVDLISSADVQKTSSSAPRTSSADDPLDLSLTRAEEQSLETIKPSQNFDVNLLDLMNAAVDEPPKA